MSQVNSATAAAPKQAPTRSQELIAAERAWGASVGYAKLAAKPEKDPRIAFNRSASKLYNKLTDAIGGEEEVDTTINQKKIGKLQAYATAASVFENPSTPLDQHGKTTFANGKSDVAHQDFLKLSSSEATIALANKYFNATKEQDPTRKAYDYAQKAQAGGANLDDI